MRKASVAALILVLTSCRGPGSASASGNSAVALPFRVTQVATLNGPWAMAFLPDGRMLVTEKAGQLRIVSQDGTVSPPLVGVPPVVAAGQGGLADVALHPDFASNQLVYLSYVEPGPNGTSGLAVGRGKLAEAGLEDFQVIWRQEPKTNDNLQFAGRLVFSADGFLFISSGDRFLEQPAQDLNQNLGKIVRLTDTGDIPSDNPYYDQGRVKAQNWSYGHRNPLGLAFDRDEHLWEVEMGPKGGDELNLIRTGRNYGWPLVSEGTQYDGRAIPRHSTMPDIEAPKISWTPSVSPSSLLVYSGSMFPAWKNSALIGTLSGQALIRVTFDADSAQEVDRFPLGARIRDVAQGPDGAVWLLEDGKQGKLLKLTPATGK
jgi:glucose/arabinose dehydrogenase